MRTDRTPPTYPLPISHSFQPPEASPPHLTHGLASQTLTGSQDRTHLDTWDSSLTSSTPPLHFCTALAAGACMPNGILWDFSIRQEEYVCHWPCIVKDITWYYLRQGKAKHAYNNIPGISV